jgi:conjugal transfer/entry exclusion protein
MRILWDTRVAWFQRGRAGCYTGAVPASQAEFDRLVQAGKQLLQSGSMVSLARCAATAGISEDAAKELYADETRRAAFERAVGARWSRAEGGHFLVR